MSEKTGAYEEFEMDGDKLLSKVRELIHEGNVRRVILKREDRTTLLELPLNAGLAVTAVAALKAPALIAVGAIAAVLSKVILVVERDPEPGEAPTP